MDFSGATIEPMRPPNTDADGRFDYVGNRSGNATMIVGTSAITEGSAAIECHLAADLDAAKLRLGYKVFHKDSVSRESVSGSKLDWRQEGGLKVGTIRVPVGDASSLQAFVSYSGISHHQWWVTDPLKTLNPRDAIHRVFDSDLEILKKLLLSPENDKSQMFELGVSTLFSLLGFSVCNYGRAPKLQDGRTLSQLLRRETLVLLSVPLDSSTEMTSLRS